MSREGSLTHDDAAILRRTAAGDHGDFEALVERHEAAVLRFIQGISRDPGRIEDALQETFVAAWRGAGEFRGGESARGWLLGIARNVVSRQYRRRAGEPPEHVPLSDLGVEAGWGAEPTQLVAKRLEDRDLVERGFRGLSPEDQEILILRDLEEFTADQVAHTLGLSLAATKSRLHRARLRFMANLRGKIHGA